MFSNSTLGRFIGRPLLGAQINWSHPLAKKLIGLWLFNEGSGDRSYDLSLHSNHGTLTNMNPEVDWVLGRDGYGLDFGGGNDYVSTNKVLKFTDPNIFTISAWVFADDVGGAPNRQTIIGHNDEATVIQFELDVTIGASDAGMNVIFPGVFVAKTNTFDWPDPTRWVHVAYTRSGSGAGNHAFWVDGVQQTLATDGSENFVQPTNNVEIGRRASGSQHFIGIISDLRVYDRALVISEILLLISDPYAIFRKSPYGRIFSVADVNLTVNVNSIVSLSEKILQAKGQIVRDNITVAELVQQGKGQIIRDNVSLAEKVLLGKGQIVRDDVTVSERVLEGIGLIVAETISATEGLSAGKGQIILDTITVAELVQFGKGLIVIDDIILGEKITQGKGQILRDAITVAEKILQAKGQIVRDTISVAEDITAVITTVGGLEVSENEVITISELIQLGKGQITRDAVSVAEKIVLGKGQIVRDTVTLTEKVLTGKGQIIIDTITVSEAVTAVLSPLLININETITVTDVATVVRSSLAAVTQKIMFMLELAKIRMFSLELDQVPQFKLALEKKPQFKLEI